MHSYEIAGKKAGKKASHIIYHEIRINAEKYILAWSRTTESYRRVVFALADNRYTWNLAIFLVAGGSTKMSLHPRYLFILSHEGQL